MYNTRNRGQTEVVGTILSVAIMVIFASVAGVAILTQFSSNQQDAFADVDYEVEEDLGGGSITYNLIVTTTNLQRADEVRVLSDGNVQGTMNSINDTVEITDIQNGDRVIVVAEYEGSSRIISTYRFNENNF